MRYVKYIRLNSGLSTTELSKRLNALYGCSINRERIVLFECNIKKPDLPTAKILAEFFNVEVEEILKNRLYKK